MVKVSSTIYDENYYLSHCLGAEKFSRTKGKDIHHNIKQILNTIKIDKNSIILDVGTGRGDIALYLAKNAKKVYGIDYSEAAIKNCE